MRLPFVILPVSIAIGACVLAEPVGDLPRAAVTRPTIVRASTVPPAGTILSSFPSVFIVPIELDDPTVDLQYAAFIDFSPTNEQSVLLLETSTFEAANLKGKTRILEIPVPPPAQLGECHPIEIVIGLELSGTSAVLAHTPRNGQGDSVQWYYNPSGDLAGCPVLQIEGGAPLPPATDSGEGGTDGGPQ